MQYRSLLRAPSTTAIFNRNRIFQRQPRPNFPCMGSSNRNHHRNLQVAVAVAVDQNFLIFGGRSLKSRFRLNRSVAACVGRPATAIWLHIAVAVENRCRGWGPLVMRSQTTSGREWDNPGVVDYLPEDFSPRRAGDEMGVDLCIWGESLWFAL